MDTKLEKDQQTEEGEPKKVSEQAYVETQVEVSPEPWMFVFAGSFPFAIEL